MGLICRLHWKLLCFIKGDLYKKKNLTYFYFFVNRTRKRHTLLFCCLTLLMVNDLPKLFCFFLFVPQVTVLFLIPVDTPPPPLPLALIAETRSLDTDITNSATTLQLFTFLSS